MNKAVVDKATTTIIHMLCDPRSEYESLSATAKINILEGVTAAVLISLTGTGVGASGLFNDVLVTGIDQRIVDIEEGMRKANVSIPKGSGMERPDG